MSSRTLSRRRHLVETLSTLLGVNGLLAGLSFVTTLAVANHLGKEGFGDLAYAIAIGGYCLTIADCALNRTLVRDLLHFPTRVDDYTSASIVLRGSLLAIALLGILSFNAFVSSANPLGAAGLLIVIAEGFKALYLGPVFDAKDEMKLHAIYFLVERLLYFALVWGAVILAGDSLTVLAIGVFMVISTALSLVLQHRWAWRRFSFRTDRKTVSLAAVMLKKNLWIWSAVLSTLSFGALSKIILMNISGSGELGIYAIAWQVVVLGSLLIAQIARLGNPWMARMVLHPGSRSQQLTSLLRYGIVLMAAGAVVGVPAILFPDVLLRLLGPEFADAATSLRILGFYVIVLSSGQMATQYLVAVRKERAYALSTIFSGGLSLVLLLLLVPRWSAIGASFAVLLSHGFGIAILLIAVFKHVLAAQQGRTDHVAPA